MVSKSGEMASPVTHVIFDVDGLLLDTEVIYTKITNEIAGEYGKVLTWDLKERQMGMKEHVAAKIVIDTEKVYVDITTRIAAEFGKTYTWEIEFKIMGKREREAAKAIIDTERFYTEITQSILDEYKKTFTWEVKSQLMGKKEREATKFLIDALELPITVDEFLDRAHAEQNRLFPSVPLMPGADKLVRHLHNCKIPIAVATGSNTKSFALKSSGHKEFFRLFHHSVLSGDDPEVEHGKPAPDCFLIAAKRFPDSPDPTKVLVFEDAPNGVDAAHAAGMQCVWVPHDQQDRDTHKHKCTQILDSLEHFIPESFGLPAYSS